MAINIKYSTAATATGGRDGRTRTDDGRIDLALSVPKEFGGMGGEGTNPEQLLAAGWAACFLSAVKHSSQQLKVHIPTDATVTANVGVGPQEQGGYGFVVTLEVSLAGVEAADAQRVVELAHQTCPYSNATRHNIDVSLEVI